MTDKHDETYMKMALGLMNDWDSEEIASALKVRDAACAAFVRQKLITHTPDDSTVTGWLDEF